MEIKEKYPKKKSNGKYTLGFTLFVCLLFLIAFFVNLFNNGSWELYILLGSAEILCLLSLVFILKQKYILAKYIVIIVPSIVFLSASLITKTNGLLTHTYGYITPRFLIILHLLTPVLLFGLYAKKHFAISISIVLIPTILFDYFHILMGVDINSMSNDIGYFPMFMAMFAFFFTLNIISIILFQKSNLIYRKKIIKQNKILELEKNSISDTHDKLKLTIQKNAEYESLIEGNEDVVFMLDKKGKQLYYNMKIENFSGYTKEELIGYSFEKFIRKSELQELRLKLNTIFKQYANSNLKEISPFEISMKHREGYYIPVELSGSIIRHNNSPVVLGTIRDITERKKKQTVLEFQSSLYTIFNIISQNKSFTKILDEVLLTLVDVNTLNLEKKGLVYLMNNVDDLEIIANLNANEFIPSSAQNSKECLCGKSISNSTSLFCKGMDHDQILNSNGIAHKGLYRVLIKNNTETFGIIYLFTLDNEEQNKNSIKFLETVATVLARKIVSNRQKKELEEKNNEINEKHTLLGSIYKQLQESIDYTRFLQKSLLPNADTIQNHFKDACVLFMPKNRVSGDFYFSYSCGDNLYFGVGDCTGHGVPGAFLSSMSVESVKTVVDSNIGEKPNVLLEKLRKNAKERFNINSDELRKDSMDMALCLYNKKENRLYFSGGFIHLIIIRNQTELIEYKGTKSPVGVYPKELPFELKEIEIEIGDVIYLTTDGYVDQFGTVQNSEITKPRKFMRKQLKNKLLEINHLESKTQAQKLKETINNWRQNIDQTDDITIFIAKHY